MVVRHLAGRSAFKRAIAIESINPLAGLNPPGIAPIGQCELTFVGRSAIDLALAQAQHRHYCETLKDLGLEVITLSGNAAFADACFVEDTAIVAGQAALITSMGCGLPAGEKSL
jgi:hypothetical protein